MQEAVSWHDNKSGLKCVHTNAGREGVDWSGLNDHFAFLKHVLRQSLVFVSVLTLVGCSQDAGPSAEDLIRRQQMRESAKLSKVKTTEERLAAVEDQLANGNVVAAQAAMRPLLISHPDQAEVIMLSAKCEAAAGKPIPGCKTSVS